MQAIVLVGGEGTRLRPLTSDVPKPALTLVDRPFLAYMIEWLAAHGVTEVVLACGFLPDVLREALGDEGERAGVRLSYVTEPEPPRHRRGDPLRRRRARRRLEERFLALNGDVLTDLDLTALMRAHEEREARATIALYPVEDSAAYGLVSCDGDGRRHRVRREDRRGGAGRDQRRRLLPRALGARPDPARPRGLDRARGLPAPGRRRARRSASTATGWTSAPPSATCRRAGTSSRAGSRRRCGRPRPACWSAPAPRSTTGAIVGPRAVVSPGCSIAAEARVCDSVLLEGCSVGAGARSAAPCSRPASRSMQAPGSTPSSPEMKESPASEP